MKYLKCRVYVYMKVKNTGSAKYTCDMMVDKLAESVTSINGQ